MVPSRRLHMCSGCVCAVGQSVCCVCWPCGRRWVSPRHEQQVKLHTSSKTDNKTSRRWEFPPTRYFGMCGPRLAKISQQPGVVQNSRHTYIGSKRPMTRYFRVLGVSIRSSRKEHRNNREPAAHNCMDVSAQANPEASSKC